MLLTHCSILAFFVTAMLVRCIEWAMPGYWTASLGRPLRSHPLSRPRAWSAGYPEQFLPGMHDDACLCL